MKALQSPLFWIVAVAAIAVIGIGVAAAIKYARRGPRGFRDYVKNPELWKEFEKEQGEGNNAVGEAQNWDDKQVETAIRRFVFGTGHSFDSRREVVVLQSLGARTHPVLWELLKDTSIRSKVLAASETDVLPEAPFNRICKLLGRNPTPDAVPLLAPFLHEKSDGIRKDAALVLASVGTESVIPLARKALRDSDEYVRSYALMGLERAREDKRLSDACRRELFADIQTLISEGRNGDQAAGLLLECDQSKATEFFLSEGMLTPKSQCLHDILRALNAKGLSVPRDRLLRLIEQLALLPPKYPRDYQLGEALHSLGKHQIAEDRTVLERYLSHSEESVAEGAAAGMIASHGLGGFADRIWRAESPTALTQPQRRYMAVMALDGEVRNGGFSQYFFNSSGDEWKAALSGLEEMGSTERLAMLREALAKFTRASPSEDRDERMQQLSKLAKANDALFDELETRYYKGLENVEVMAVRYVLKNPDAFR